MQVGPQIRKASVEKRRSFLHTNLLNRHSVIPEEEEETSDHENQETQANNNNHSFPTPKENDAEAN